MGKYSKKRKKSGLLVAIALLLLVAVGGTLAYIFTSTEPLQNIFNPSQVSCAVLENQDTTEHTSDSLSGVTTKREVMIKNTGNTDAYIRVALVVTWKNEDGKVWAKAPVPDADYSMTLDLNKGWVRGTDGFYYYTFSVKSNDLTNILISEAEQLTAGPIGTDGKQYYLSIEIVASAVQSTPAEAVSAWSNKVAAVKDDGTLDVKK